MHIDDGIRRVADLHLRGHDGAIPVRVHWPAAGEGPVPLALFLPDNGVADGVREGDEELCRELCSALGSVTLCAPWYLPRAGAPFSPLERASAALEWSADHAHELGADPDRIVVAGRGAGAAAAVVLALRARDRGWPGIVRQLLFVECATRDGGAVRGTALSALGLAVRAQLGPRPAPATVVAAWGRGGDPGLAPCAERLRAAGIAVEEREAADRAGLWLSMRRALRSPGPGGAREGVRG